MKLIKKYLLALIIAGYGMSRSFAQQADDIKGKWFADALEESLIMMEEVDGKYVGTITESKAPDYVGKKVVYDLVYQPEEAHYKGRIFAISRKMELDGTFSLEGENLKVVGKKLFMTRTFYWERVE